MTTGIAYRLTDQRFQTAENLLQEYLHTYQSFGHVLFSTDLRMNKTWIKYGVQEVLLFIAGSHRFQGDIQDIFLFNPSDTIRIPSDVHDAPFQFQKTNGNTWIRIQHLPPITFSFDPCKSVDGETLTHAFSSRQTNRAFYQRS